MRAVVLKVDGRTVKSTDITFDDLLWLFSDYTKRHGEVPTQDKCLAKNNLPQGRIVRRVLSEAGVSFNDFMNMLGKTSHVRTESDDFEKYFHRYMLVAEKLGRAPKLAELKNNSFGLPSASWFISRCPDKHIRSYSDFISWCGLKPTKKVWSKEEVVLVLSELQEKIGRPITRYDICKDTTGFSMIVINRLFGSLGNAKREIRLDATEHYQGKPFEYYKNLLADTVTRFHAATKRTKITWRDIESGMYGDAKAGHKSYLKAFNKSGVDIFSYIKTLGCEMKFGEYGSSYTFDDGERVRSSMEYDFSNFLRFLGLTYNKDYRRDVKYRNYIDIDSRIDCDYVFDYFGTTLFIEIAGMIYEPQSGNYFTHDYGSERSNSYRDKMYMKQRILDGMNANYLFLFCNDMKSDSYEDKFIEFVARSCA